MSTSGFWNPVAEQQTTFNFSRAPLAQQRRLLPVHKHRKQILYAIEENGIIVITGETGCGKSTQVPQYLYENGWCSNNFRIAITQPRRIAAQTLAQRVAKEMGENNAGETVGYSVRFDSRQSPSTAIVYMTDGMLLREASMRDPLLSRYSVIIVDEAHERTLHSDALIGLLKLIRRKRLDLRIIICSATIDAEAFLSFFYGAPKKRKRRWDNPLDNKGRKLSQGTIISVDGRQYSVDLLYLESPTSDYIRSSVETAVQIIREQPTHECGILCFLPSSEDCDDAIRMAQELVDQEPEQLGHLVLLPLHGSLPYQLQARVFQNPGREQRRIIFSTNVAETSVTVPLITHVVDSGYVKLPVFDPETQFDRLLILPTSQASAQQRAGRAGRVQDGHCYRLYMENFYRDQMQPTTPPDIIRTNLTSFILTLKALGVDNILAFDLMDSPGIDALSHGLESLYALGALNDQSELTPLGWEMSAFPTDPRITKMIFQSFEEECTKEILAVASLSQVRSIFLTPRKKHYDDWVAAMSQIADDGGDHTTFVNAILEQEEQNFSREECQQRFLDYVALRRVLEVRTQLEALVRRVRGRTIPSIGAASQDERSTAIRKCVTAGFFLQVAKLKADGKYYTLRMPTQVTPSTTSIFHTHGRHSEYICFCEATDGARGGIEIRSVSAINPKWLRELAPHYWE